MAGDPFAGKGGTATAPAPTQAPAQTPPAADAPAGGMGFAAGDPFASPTGLSAVKIADWLGELILVRPTKETEMVTKVSKGEKNPVVMANILPITGDGVGEGWIRDVAVFQIALRRELVEVLEGPAHVPYLLATLVRGEEKDGKSAPYLFQAATPEQEAMARTALASSPDPLLR